MTNTKHVLYEVLRMYQVLRAWWPTWASVFFRRRLGWGRAQKVEKQREGPKFRPSYRMICVQWSWRHHFSRHLQCLFAWEYHLIEVLFIWTSGSLYIPFVFCAGSFVVLSGFRFVSFLPSASMARQEAVLGKEEMTKRMQIQQVKWWWWRRASFWSSIRVVSSCRVVFFFFLWRRIISYIYMHCSKI